MDSVLLRQGAQTLSKCGFLRSDKTGVYVPIEKKFLLPMVISANQSLVFTKEITGDAVFGLRAISCDKGLASTTGVRLNLQLPNGRFLMGGNGIDVGQFAWVGSYRFLMTEELDCEPGSKFSVSLADTNAGGLAEDLPVNLLFEGCYKYYVKGAPGGADESLASALPRYQGIGNENILAPCWRQGSGPKALARSEGGFVYSHPVVTVALAGPVYATQKIPIDNGYDFFCRRILFDIEADATVTAGNFLVRLRTGDGYALNDDFVDLPRYIGGAEYPGNWRIRGGDQVVVEIALVDFAGTGNMTIQTFLEGERRAV